MSTGLRNETERTNSEDISLTPYAFGPRAVASSRRLDLEKMKLFARLSIVVCTFVCARQQAHAYPMTLKGYPPASKTRSKEFYARWEQKTLIDAAYGVTDRPLRDAEVDLQAANPRLFFAKGASKFGGNSSHAFPLAQWMVRVEQGRMVNVLNALVDVDTTGDTLAPPAMFWSETRPSAIAAAPMIAPLAPSPAGAPQGPTSATKPASPTGVISRTPIYIVVVMSNELKKSAAENHGRLAREVPSLMLSALGLQ